MKLIQLYFKGVFCGWADPKYVAFFRIQGYNCIIHVPTAPPEWWPL